MFKRILVANRGEIAVRIIRACRELDIESVAVYSEADRDALHVKYADYSYPVGPAPSAESYLRIDRIIDAARKSRAEAIHPGYGFLAENPAFARACGEAGLVFLGPAPDVIKQMGDKVHARALMKKAGLPVIPGSDDILSSEEEVLETAEAIGYPCVLKAVAGGGGKGLRLVESGNEVRSAFRAVRSEAASSFGDSRLYVEKYLERCRHIEVQLLADIYGKVLHLFTRECSIQRRHQKIIEECPAPSIDVRMQKAMGKTAAQGAKALKYTGVGTMEFLVDRQKNFYFLEMNTRLQVEHAITERVMGIDLVKAQINVAAGMPLPWSQRQIQGAGHAIECRIYAEDPRDRLHALSRQDRGAAPARGLRHPQRLRRVRGRRDPHLLRPHDRQAHRLGRGPRRGHPAPQARLARVPGPGASRPTSRSTSGCCATHSSSRATSIPGSWTSSAGS